MIQHQYVGTAGEVVTEKLFGDRIVRFLYSSVREKSPVLFRALTGRRVSSVLGYVNFDAPLAGGLLGNDRFLRSCGVDLSEYRDDPRTLKTPRAIFERKIRYEECRPMPPEPEAVVSPADARVVVGSLAHQSTLCLKQKFFEFSELLSPDKSQWIDTFHDGDVAIFRLTPDKYHYNHAPVAGKVIDFYVIPGGYHSCNPGAVIELLTPYSKNRRVVTMIQTDVEGGTGVGLVAFVEIVALMIGEVVQCYSEAAYDSPQPITPGLFIQKGRPKSLYRPGSSTTVVIFQKGRVTWEPQLLDNLARTDVESRFSLAFGQPLAETDVRVRSRIAMRAQ